MPALVSAGDGRTVSTDMLVRGMITSGWRHRRTRRRKAIARNAADIGDEARSLRSWSAGYETSAQAALVGGNVGEAGRGAGIVGNDRRCRQ